MVPLMLLQHGAFYVFLTNLCITKCWSRYWWSGIFNGVSVNLNTQSWFSGLLQLRFFCARWDGCVPLRKLPALCRILPCGHFFHILYSLQKNVAGDWMRKFYRNLFFFLKHMTNINTITWFKSKIILRVNNINARLTLQKRVIDSLAYFGQVFACDDTEKSLPYTHTPLT